MFDLFGRKRIAELEAENAEWRHICDSWKKDYDHLDADLDKALIKVRSLKCSMRRIYEETQYGKSGTAQKVARMAKEALKGPLDD